MQSIAHIRGGDQVAVRAFLSRLSPETRRARYLGPVHFHPHALEREMRRLQNTDATSHTVLLAKEGDQVRGIGEYVTDGSEPERAEVALVVEDAFQGQGIGRLLLRNLECHALQRGIRVFTGEVANDNHRVVALLRSAAGSFKLQPAYASSHFELSLSVCQS